MNPLVSIITPSFNQSEYLEQAILSVLSQEYNPVEYMIIDGGSQDGSVDIIQRYAERLAWWVSEPDAGQAEAINKGLQRAHGEYVAWLNSDDLLQPGVLQQAVQTLEAHPQAAFVFGDAITIDPDGQVLKRLSFQDWILRDFMAFRMICQPAVLMRRANLLKSGSLDPTYHYLLDHHLWIRLACHGSVKHAPIVWAAARHHPGAKNVAQPAAFSQEVKRILLWMGDQPELAPILSEDNRRIQGGAYRLSARYLLDGEQPKDALRDYWKAMQYDPGYTLKHWHRILYTLLSLAGLKSISGWYFHAQRAIRNNRHAASTHLENSDSSRFR